MESPSTTGSPCLSYDVDQARLVLLQDGERHEISIRAQAHRLVRYMVDYFVYQVPFLGAIPLGIEVREGGDNGVPVVVSNPESPQAQAFRKVSEEVARYISIEAMKPELVVLGKGQ